MPSVLPVPRVRRRSPRVLVGALLGDSLCPDVESLRSVRHRAPPFFLAHGSNDSYVPVAQARQLAEHLSAGSSNPVWYAELPGAQHGFDAYRSWRFSALVYAVDAFLTQDLAARPTTHR